MFLLGFHIQTKTVHLILPSHHPPAISLQKIVIASSTCILHSSATFASAVSYSPPPCIHHSRLVCISCWIWKLLPEASFELHTFPHTFQTPKMLLLHQTIGKEISTEVFLIGKVKQMFYVKHKNSKKGLLQTALTRAIIHCTILRFTPLLSIWLSKNKWAICKPKRNKAVVLLQKNYWSKQEWKESLWEKLQQEDTDRKNHG